MRIYSSFVAFFIFTFSCIQLYAQQSGMPHTMTLAEQRIMADYLREKHASSILSIPVPPPGQVRTMAEWEEIQALIITWSGQATILKEIVRHAVKECKVLIITTNPDNVSGQLTSAGIPLDSVEFVNTPFNSIWVRDYGPWTVYKNDVDSLWLVDWIYNRPRQNDDASPVAVAQHLNLPIYEATTFPYNWVHTGGNHLPDGMGTVFSSMLVLEENPEKSEAQIDSIANLFLGVKQYIKFPTLPFDGIHHLDMHMRIIDEETIFFGQYPEGIADGPQIEANINYLTEEFNTAFDNKYNIVRLPMPPDASGRYPNTGGAYRTYTNSVFVNKTVLVPTYEERYDTTALRIYRENLPGYNVVGINCNSIIGSLGAIHCITKTVGDDDPLLIAHPRLRDADDASLEYPVVAYIKHREGIADADLYFRVAPDSIYTQVPMVLIDSAANSWAALIPPQLAGSEIQYYIHAMAHNGKEQVRPMVAPEGYFRFRVTGELPNHPPLVSIVQPLDGSVFSIDEAAIPVGFDAFDADGHIQLATLYINGDEVATFDTLPYLYDWTITAEGVYAFVVDVVDDDGAVASSDTVHITIEGTTAVYEGLESAGIAIYPNPVEDELVIDCMELNTAISSVDIYNMLGQIQSASPIQQSHQMVVDFSALPPGIYMLKIRIEQEVYGYKVFKW
ncbi:MAG: agmatine deiminase family protein [Saprospiraceae bacterium]|nr:agmatine deiminase family protein [Saprospiraceae bacterium]